MLQTINTSNVPILSEKVENTFKIIFCKHPSVSYLFKGICLSAGMFLMIILLTQWITRQPLLVEIHQLKTENTRLKNELAQKNAQQGGLFPNQNVIVVTPLPLPKKTPDKNNLLVRVGTFSLERLPTLRKILAVLKVRDVKAKFIFSPTNSKRRIMEQIERYGHQIIFEGSRPEWAEKNSLIFTPHSPKPSFDSQYHIDFDRRADAPGQTIAQLVDLIRNTKPEEKLLVDPYQNSNVPWALLLALKQTPDSPAHSSVFGSDHRQARTRKNLTHFKI